MLHVAQYKYNLHSRINVQTSALSALKLKKQRLIEVTTEMHAAQFMKSPEISVSSAIKMRDTATTSTAKKVAECMLSAINNVANPPPDPNLRITRASTAACAPVLDTTMQAVVTAAALTAQQFITPPVTPNSRIVLAQTPAQTLVQSTAVNL